MLRPKRLFVLFTAVLLLCALNITVYAQPVPNLSQKGSVKINMPYKETPVSGGSMTLYRVGAVRENDGNYDFKLTGDFSDCGIALKDIQSAGLAKKLADYAAKEKLKGKTQKLDENGSVVFSKLEPGLYLMVQNQAAKGYQKANPFLVSLPMLENGTYIYDVQADPKVEVISDPTVTKTPDVTPTIKTGSGGGGSKLPQTGQLNWPVPVLALAGLVMFSFGWILRYGKRNDDEK